MQGIYIGIQIRKLSNKVIINDGKFKEGIQMVLDSAIAGPLCIFMKVRMTSFLNIGTELGDRTELEFNS